MSRNVALAGTFALGLFLAATVPGNAETSQMTIQQVRHTIRTAHTKADHRALTSFYEAKAREARKWAELHREMAQDYEESGKPEDESQVPLMQSIAKQYDEMAAKYDALAAHHRTRAQTVPK
ncbi:putative uncharacterized protein [Burkholderiales bacterium GJ-E10]|nr:putative uncharacterized protein [Burkholderiales bacterium GJ-E10]